MGYHGDRNTGITNGTQSKHRHTSSNNASAMSSLKQSFAASNNPFMSINSGTLDNSNFRAHQKNALSVGTYENSAKLVKRNNFMSQGNSLKNSSA
jgi:hypothetical protein